MTAIPIPKETLEDPDDYLELASKLSWEDATNLLCFFERGAIDSRGSLETRANTLEQAERMRVLVRNLPYDWQPRPRDPKRDFIVWLAASIRN